MFLRITSMLYAICKARFLCITLMIYIYFSLCISLVLYMVYIEYNIDVIHGGDMARKMMVGNRKGGVGKSTTVVNIAYELSKLKKRVLLTDFDGQGNASNTFIHSETPYYVGDVLLDRKFDISKAIYPAVIKGEEQEYLHVLPARSGDIMTELEMKMIPLTKREERLNLQLEKINDNYDFIIMDTDPGTSILGLNAVFAADEYIIPTIFRESSIEGIDMLLQHIQDVKFIDEEDINFTIFRCRVDRRATRDIDYFNSRLEMLWSQQISKVISWERNIFGNAEQENLPISVYAPKHEAAAYYRNFAKELVAS